MDGHEVVALFEKAKAEPEFVNLATAIRELNKAEAIRELNKAEAIRELNKAEGVESWRLVRDCAAVWGIDESGLIECAQEVGQNIKRLSSGEWLVAPWRCKAFLALWQRLEGETKEAKDIERLFVKARQAPNLTTVWEAITELNGVEESRRSILRLSCAELMDIPGSVLGEVLDDVLSGQKDQKKLRVLVGVLATRLEGMGGER